MSTQAVPLQLTLPEDFDIKLLEGVFLGEFTLQTPPACTVQQ
ncbi:MAG: hypothetical protein R3E95_12045 [Thiolinea sp.]